MTTKQRLLKVPMLAICWLILLPLYSANAADNLSAESQFEQMLQQHQGKVIYVDFWASWCVPCRRSFPWMNTMQKNYAAQGFTVISINLDAKKPLADKFLSEYPAHFPVIYDSSGSLAKKFQLKGMPSSFTINKAGKVVSSHVGFTDDKKLKYQQEIEQLLQQPQ